MQWAENEKVSEDLSFLKGNEEFGSFIQTDERTILIVSPRRQLEF